MIKDANGGLSLCRTIFAATWLLVLAGVVNYLWFNGPDVAGLAAALLTPAGAVYAMREHSKHQKEI